MPLYLCLPGLDSKEPWTQYLEVFQEPCSAEDEAKNVKSYRLSHSEIVLISAYVEAYDCYWLQLRKPGPNGSAAGYVKLNKDDSCYFPSPTGNICPLANNSVSIHPSLFPSHKLISLLKGYEDGLESNSSQAEAELTDDEDDLSPPLEPVFCRICRDGLHDVFDEQPPGGGEENNVYQSNPLLKPCECSGSMAFVHRICIEEWRIRSRHSGSENGNKCETCNATYALPPKPPRIENNENGGQDDLFWQGDERAMPPHVRAALMRPHPWWQLCSAIVRHHYLRPLAPIFCSPLVALYCRSRRILKKQGVSRRRWACSLCRRRARWKCVRCLRSYYCSRQCQNVSWHIMHKHMCYKPSRLAWSTVAYTSLLLYLHPGVFAHPVVYSTLLVWSVLNFYYSSWFGGSVAVLGRRVGVDLRGRTLEAIVVMISYTLSKFCQRLLWSYFGLQSSGKMCRPGPLLSSLANVSLVDEAKLFLKLNELQSAMHTLYEVAHHINPFFGISICSNKPLAGWKFDTTCLNTDLTPVNNDCLGSFRILVILYYFMWLFISIMWAFKKFGIANRVRRREHID